MLGPLFFLIYINDLADNIMSGVKLFADDTSVFNVVFDTDISAEVLNQDLKAVQDWAYQWKMSFNPDPAKQAEQVIIIVVVGRNHYIKIRWKSCSPSEKKG